jgi:hypothetical protein
LKTLNQRIGDLGPARRKRVETRAVTLIAEELTLQELRQARKLTQEPDGENGRHQSAIDCGFEEL